MKSWCIPKPSAQFVAKMEDVLDVYQRPYDPQQPVVCLDEVSKELHSTPRGVLPMASAQTACADYEYERHGVCNLFLSVEPLTGRCQVRLHDRRTALDLAEVLQTIVDKDYPQADKIILVTDNLNTHSPACLYQRFAPAEARRIAAKLEWHYTPEHGSWLNIAECQLSVLTRQCLNRRIPDKTSLDNDINAWVHRRNRTTAIVHWHFTTADARIKLRHLYPIVKEQDST